MAKTIPFKENKVKRYLDTCIWRWRATRDQERDATEKVKASCYIDAFQSVRVSIFGEVLK